MAAVIVFHETTENAAGIRRSIPVNNMTEIHVFEADEDALRFSQANLTRPHTVRKINGERWHPSTKGGDR